MNVEAFRLSKSKGSPAVLLQQLGFGLGAMAAPKIVNAFVMVTPLDISNITLTNESWIENETDILHGVTYSKLGDVSKNLRHHKMNIVKLSPAVFVVVGVITATCCIACFVIFIIGSVLGTDIDKEEVKTINCSYISKAISPGTCTGGHAMFGAMFFILLSISCFLSVGGDTAVRQFLYSYSIETDVGFTPEQASNLNMAYWVTYNLSRVMNLLIGLKVNIAVLFATEMALSLIVAIVLAVYGSNNPTILVVFIICWGLFNTALFPNCIVFSNYYVKMTGTATGLIFLAAGLGVVFFVWLSGYFFHEYGPETLMTIIVISTSILAVIYATLQFVASSHEKKIKQESRLY